MESGLPMLNCVLQHTLRSLCTSSSSDTSSIPSKWVYAVFWKIIPRIYPPPKWDHRGCLVDRAKGNKRNWILVWEDGFCDFYDCERAGSGYVKGRFGADIFFKMSHEVYNFGEGLVGKVASDNSQKWIFRDTPTENDPNFNSSWNVSIDPQPKAWEAQFNSGIETIAIISVKEGAIQLGSFNKVVEDLNLVLSIQRKFSYLQSLPGVYTIQRPFSQIHNSDNFDYNNSAVIMERNGSTLCKIEDNSQKSGFKRLSYEQPDNSLTKSMYLGYNSPHNAISNAGELPLWPIPPLMPSMPRHIGAFFSKIPSVPLSCYVPEGIGHEHNLMNNNAREFKGCTSGSLRVVDECRGVFDEVHVADVKEEQICAQDQEGKPGFLGFEHHHRGEKV